MKSKSVAYVLWLVSIFGWLGFQRFYLRKVGTGIIWILTFGVGGLGALTDMFTLGGQVEQYNTNQQLKHIRANALAKGLSQTPQRRTIFLGRTTEQG